MRSRAKAVGDGAAGERGGSDEMNHGSMIGRVFRWVERAFLGFQAMFSWR